MTLNIKWFHRVKLVNKFIRNFVNKMNTRATKNKTVIKIIMKRVVINYKLSFYNLIKIHLKVFELSFIVMPPSKLKTILSTKIYPIEDADLSRLYSISFIKERDVSNYYVGTPPKKFQCLKKDLRNIL